MAEQNLSQISEEVERAARELEQSGMTPLEYLQSKVPPKSGYREFTRVKRENGTRRNRGRKGLGIRPVVKLSLDTEKL